MEVKGYPNYLIYPDGIVWSKKNKIFLKERIDKGYLRVVLCKDGIHKTHSIHRLVALHYIPNPDNKPEVDHWNGKRNDNRVENLRWATHSENNQNKGVRKDNKLGIKNICYDKSRDKYKYEKIIEGVKHIKYFKTLEEALCYKYIFILKMRAGLV
jgi:hypothetical protein